jgi:hypothetical protein
VVQNNMQPWKHAQQKVVGMVRPEQHFMPEQRSTLDQFNMVMSVSQLESTKCLLGKAAPGGFQCRLSRMEVPLSHLNCDVLRTPKFPHSSSQRRTVTNHV